MIGIYKITNLINNKLYIGQSKDIQQRWLHERSRAFNPKSNTYNTPLSRAFRKYGLENFTFEVIEICPIEELDEKEKAYILLYQTLVPLGYNVSSGGTMNRNHAVKLTYEKVQEISNLLKKSSLSQLEIAEIYTVSKDTITDINLGHTWFNPMESYPLRKTTFYCKNCGQQISNGATLCSTCKGIADRKVERPSKEILLSEIATSSFVAVGKKYGVSDKAIVKWCKAYGLPIHKKEIVELYNNLKN